MKDEFEQTALPGVAATSSATPAVKPVISLDVALYEHYLSDGGMTPDQKREFLEALWSIIVGFVDLGFGIDPIEQARPADDGGGQIRGLRVGDGTNLVSSVQPPVTPASTSSLRTEIQSVVGKGRRT